MPELPEVETTRRGISRHVVNNEISQVIIRQPRLRYPVSRRLSRELPGNIIRRVDRLGKYLLLKTTRGTVLVHLGMSGSLRIVSSDTPYERHDHVDVRFNDGRSMRLRDPRRFGLVLWTTRDPAQHPLLKGLGPEPLSPAFDGDYLYCQSRGRKLAIKQLIMDAGVVMGIGNIYANEALFMSGIHPLRPAGRLSRQRYEVLARAVKRVLREAVTQGGTTLRDFVDGEGRPGYFRQYLKVYDREGLPCVKCGAAIRHIRQGQRSTYYCSGCQR